MSAILLVLYLHGIQVMGAAGPWTTIQECEAGIPTFQAGFVEQMKKQGGDPTQYVIKCELTAGNIHKRSTGI